MNQSNFLKIYIIPLLIISPMMTISCNSWFSIWMMMELNTMTFIPLIIFFNKFYKELSFKYFIVQTISSSIFIMMTNSIMINYQKNFLWIKFILNLMLLMKLGFPPFHLWFINMMSNMNWINCLILSTWQKIIPMIMMMFTYIKLMNLTFLVYATFLSTMLSLNQQSLRVIFSYSSINHMSWMLLNLMISEMTWIIYFMMYMIMNSGLMILMHIHKIYYMNQMFIINQFKHYKLLLFMNLMSICGLPPMFGFNMKWISIYYFSVNNLYFINMIMIIMSILTFIFYTRIIISFLTLSMMKNKLFLMSKFSSFNFKLIFIILSFMNLWLMSTWLY